MRLFTFAILGLLLGGAASAEDKKKMPALDAKEWKEVKGGEGLKTWDFKEGKGTAAVATDKVRIHYIGWLTDGTKFDSDDGKGIEFPLKNLIKGWQEGVPGMKPGGVRRLYIPWKKAYGEKGSPPLIPAKADLVFEIELIEVK